MLADVIVADRNMVERGYLPWVEGDIDIGESNTFELRVPPGSLSVGWYVMLEGTDMGGVVDGIESDTGNDYISATGRTWTGILEGNLVKPDPGQTHLVASGDANDVLSMLVSRLGLVSCMAASREPSGLDVTGWRFTRISARMGAYTQIRDMLRSVGAKLIVSYDGASRRAVLSAVPRREVSDDGPDGDRMRVAVGTRRRVNHLHCMGTGEGGERTTLDLFVDERGRISRTQTIFGAAHIEEAYELSASDADGLEEDGTEHLLELQADSAWASVGDVGATDYDIGDMVTVTAPAAGIRVRAEVVGKVASLADGEVTVEIKTETEG